VPLKEGAVPDMTRLYGCSGVEFGVDEEILKDPYGG
jgi:hypothetical protein